MSTTSKRRTRKSRKATSSETQTTSSESLIMKKPETITPEIPDNVRTQLQNVTSEIIFAAQEVGFVLAELECEKRAECPLVEKTKELVRKIRALSKLQWELAKLRQPESNAPDMYA